MGEPGLQARCTRVPGVCTHTRTCTHCPAARVQVGAHLVTLNNSGLFRGSREGAPHLFSEPERSSQLARPEERGREACECRNSAGTHAAQRSEDRGQRYRARLREAPRRNHRCSASPRAPRNGPAIYGLRPSNREPFPPLQSPGWVPSARGAGKLTSTEIAQTHPAPSGQGKDHAARLLLVAPRCSHTVPPDELTPVTLSLTSAI